MTASVSVTFQIPRILQAYSQGCLAWEVPAETVGELLECVQQQQPELYVCICDETGQLRRHVNLFLNQQLFDRRSFETPLQSGDVVSVFQAVSGG